MKAVKLSKNKVKVILTFDMEYVKGYTDSSIKNSISKILNLLEEVGARATFFVSSNIIENNIQTIKKIGAQHEIGSHGHSHANLKKLNDKQINTEISKSKQLIEGLGFECKGFRAPYFIKPKNLDKLLVENGYLYDSSLCRTFFPGRFNNRSISNTPYKTKLDGKPFFEIPVSSNGFLKVPYGLSYIRALYPLFKPKFQNHNCFFLHTYEFTNSQPFDNLTWPLHFVQKRNIGKNAMILFEDILKNKEIEWISCIDYINLINNQK